MDNPKDPIVVVDKKSKKKKKHHVGLWIALGIVFVLVIAPIGLSYAMFFDNTSTEMKVDADFTQEQFANKLLVKSLDSAKSDKQIELTITKNDLNQLLYSAVGGALNDTVKQYIKSFYIDITDDYYDFYVEADAKLFKTRACIRTTLDDYIDENDHSNDAFKFKVEDVRLGRVGGFVGIAKKILTKYVSNSTVQNAISSAGLSMNVDLDNLEITYKHIDLLTDIKKLIGSSEQTDIYFSAVKDLFNNNMFSFEFNDEHAIQGIVHLDTLATNPDYCTEDKNINLALDDYCLTLKNMLNTSLIDEAHAQTTFSYLLIGYERMDDTFKNYINGKDLSSIGIDDVTTYTGNPLLTNEDNINSLLVSQMSIQNIAKGQIGRINEDQVNKVIRSTNVVGFTYLIMSNTNGAYKVNYLCVDNFYVNIVDGKIYMTIGLNINGFETSVVFVATSEGCQNYKLTFSIDAGYFGTYKVGNELEDLFFDIVEEAINSEDWIGFDKAKRELYIDFTNAIAINETFKNAIDTYGVVDIACVGENLSSMGYLDVTGKAK